MPTNSDNKVFPKGVENLLPPTSISEEFCETVEIVKRRGGQPISTETKITQLRKMDFCKHICHQRCDPSDFAKFAVVLDTLAELAL